MKTLIKNIICCFFAFGFFTIYAQGDVFLKKDVSKKINFQFISNLIIIPVDVNGVTLSFLLDTGVSRPILFNLTERDSLNLKDIETYYLHGLGADGEIEALKSKRNTFRIGNVSFGNKDLYVLYDNSINFTPRLGVLVHGIIGYDVFKNFVVEINYSKKFIRLHKPESFTPETSKKWKTLPLQIHNKKPYIKSQVTIEDIERDVKLLIDTGSTDALWLFEDEHGLSPNKDLYFRDFLGKGLSGSVYGKRSKVKNLRISDFKIPQVNVAFPDSASIIRSKIYRDRNGSIGGEVLKRFNHFFDYKNNKLHIKKNGRFKAPFTYNNSGIVLEYNGFMFVKERINTKSLDSYGNETDANSIQVNQSLNHVMSAKPAYRIVEIRQSSNAFKAGLKIGDILMSINGRAAYNYKLSAINEIIHGKTGKTIRVKINRNGRNMFFKFKLDNVLKKSEPSD